ncbi:ATP-binding protein [Streptomyces sp. NPDC006012]|uniref:ATP-binding protein n=1 Tax=Streptomyces sp. NPDC006012 TaxID=3364739 RepID=UPI003692B5CA
MTPHTTPTIHRPVAAPPYQEHWFGLPALRTSVKAARDTVRERLCSWRVPGDLCCDAVLLVSELATNAVIHTGSRRFLCGLSLAGNESLHIEVHDDDHTTSRPTGRHPGPRDEGGRGLLLVHQLSADWGADRSTRTQGTVVWADLRYCA